MATLNLTDNFNAFFKIINPNISYTRIAASQYNTIKGLIEDKNGLAKILSPMCFLQGSYQRDTAIFTINDVDIVVLCELWQPGSGSGNGWSRNDIFDTIAAPLLNDGRYKDKIRYNSGSMCIKLDLGIKVEILPVVYKTGNNDPQKEPFRLHRPETNNWEDGYARYHQQLLIWKNSGGKTEGNFIPAIKVFKHINSLYNLDSVSFHLECFLFALPDVLFKGNPPDFINNICSHISKWDSSEWYQTKILTPCKERELFSDTEWDYSNFVSFHKIISIIKDVLQYVVVTTDKNYAIHLWQNILGKDYFPATTK
jgi:hypothetical protein